MRKPLSFACVIMALTLPAGAAVTATILAGGETDLPADTPSGRLDTEGVFPFVGALEISGGAGSFKGSAVAISREWVLTAGHNADLDDKGGGAFEVFRYDFDHPASTGQPGGSLGNDVETVIGPGDSGGAAMRQRPDGSWELVGINTFTEGYGGRFGDTGGGALVEPYTDWISRITGIPEPSNPVLMLVSTLLMLRRKRVQ